MKKTSQLLLAKTIGFYLNVLSILNLEKAKNVSYRLFSQPRKGKLKKEKLPKILQTAKQETIQFEEDFFQIYTWNNSKTEQSEANKDIILLVHGWESNASRWKKILPHLKQLNKTIIAIDAPAHGLSSGKEFNAPKYAEFINEFSKKYSPKIMIGHSIGGAAICYYLHKHKNQEVEKIVMLGSPSEFKIMSDNFINLLGLNDKIQKALENHYYEKFDININDFSGHLFSKEFTHKAFIAHDLHDDIVKIDQGRKYASHWQNATFIETSGLGHSMHDNELYAKIVNFIKE